ncbi:MAG: DUF305 domain-containing protein [Mycobacteriaceae bacterium]
MNTDANNADSEFARTRYLHHDQAIEISALAPGGTANQAVLDLASSIQNAQKPEMDQIIALLKQWNQPAPTGLSREDMNMGSTPTGDGMMIKDNMIRIAGLSGCNFDEEWLTMMIDQHNGAISMSKTEIAMGKNSSAKGIAEIISAAQQSEVATMKSLLNQLK